MLTESPIAKSEVSPARHLEIVTKVYTVLGGIGVLMSLPLIIIGLSSVVQRRHDMGGLALYVGMIWLVQCLPAYLGARALRNGRNWGRNTLLVVNLLSFLYFPIGVVWGGYVYWVLFRKPTRELLGLTEEGLTDEEIVRKRFSSSLQVFVAYSIVAGILVSYISIVQRLIAHLFSSHTYIPTYLLLAPILLTEIFLYWRLAQSVIEMIPDTSQGRIRRAGVGATLAVVALVPSWDIIPGAAYFGYLCNTETEVQVTRTVTDVDFVDSKIAPGREVRYRLGTGHLSTDYVVDPPSRYEHRMKASSMGLTVMRRQDMLIDRETSELLATKSAFYWEGGWVVNTLGWKGYGMGCPRRGPNLYDLLDKAIVRD